MTMYPKQPYQPISCTFHDILEALATEKKIVAVEFYVSNNACRCSEAVILDFETKDKEEFIILDNGARIRLDQLLSVDGKEVYDYC
jgi:Rho-binding antiterminator